MFSPEENAEGHKLKNQDFNRREVKPSLMTYNDNQGGFSPRPQRQLFDVTDMNLKCASCGKPIEKLPFRPNPERTKDLYCYDCNKNRPRNNYSR